MVPLAMCGWLAEWWVRCRFLVPYPVAGKVPNEGGTFAERPARDHRMERLGRLKKVSKTSEKVSRDEGKVPYGRLWTVLFVVGESESSAPLAISAGQGIGVARNDIAQALELRSEHSSCLLN